MDKGIVTRYRIKKYLKIFTLILFLSLVGLLTYSYVRIVPSDVTFSNVTSSSVTVSWSTKFPTRGSAIVVDAINKLPISILGLTSDIFHDTRDVRQSELLASFETSGNVGSSSSLGVLIGDFVTERKITDKGTYYTHHVEIKGLQPESEYRLMIGDGFSFINTLITSSSQTIKTVLVPESIRTPHPVYGQIKDAGNQNIDFEDLDVLTDGIVYFNFLDEASGERSTVFSSTLNNEGSWYIDASYATNSNGEPFIEKYSNEVTNILGEITIDAGPLGIWKKTVNINETSPTLPIVLNDPELINDDSNPEILQRVSSNINSSELVKGVNASSCVFVGFCTCGQVVDYQWKDCVCPESTFKARGCHNQPPKDVYTAVQETNSSQGGCGGGGVLDGVALVGQTCRYCSNEGGVWKWRDVPSNQKDRCDGMQSGQINNTIPVPVPQKIDMRERTVATLCRSSTGCNCTYTEGESTFVQKDDVCSVEETSETTTPVGTGEVGIQPTLVKGQYCGVSERRDERKVYNKKLECVEIGSLCLSNSSVRYTYSQSGDCVPDVPINRKGQGCGYDSTVYKSKVYNNTGQCVVVSSSCSDSKVYDAKGDCVDREVIITLEGFSCADSNNNMASGVTASDGSCIERTDDLVLTRVDLLSESEAKSILEQTCWSETGSLYYAPSPSEKAYTCVNMKWKESNFTINCTEGKNNTCDALRKNWKCINGAGKELTCNGGDGKWFEQKSSPEIAVQRTNVIQGGDECKETTCVCKVTGYNISNGEFCVEVESRYNCAFKFPVRTGYRHEKKVCDTDGSRCVNGECKKSSEAPIGGFLKDKFIPKAYSQESFVNESEYIIDTSTGMVSGLSVGSYIFEVEGETFFFTVDDSNVGSGVSELVIYIDKNDNGQYDEGIDKKISEYGSEVKISSINKRYDYKLKQGFNFVSIPFLVSNTESRTAAGLLSSLNEVYRDSIFSIAKYDGKWHVVGQNTTLYDNSDFQLVPGQGYVIKARHDIDISIVGKPVVFEKAGDNATITLYPGWNLIGTYGTDVKKYTAKSLIQGINKFEPINFTSDNVSRWESDVQKYDGYQLTNENGVDIEYGFDFPINLQQSYFVRILQGRGNWQQELK